MNWKWFLQWLKRSLDLDYREQLTIMSDMQKGLHVAVKEVLPLAEHRLCARHIYANWSKVWRGVELKKKFFACLWSTYEEQFSDNLTEMTELKSEAATTVVSYPVKGWVRAYFSTRSCTWMVDNNACESFNAWIYELRFLPIIRMVDGIRLKMMAKWAESQKNAYKWRGEFSPKCLHLFEVNKRLSIGCNVFFNGDDNYEVCEGDNKHTV